MTEEQTGGWDNKLGVPSRWVKGGKQKEVGIRCHHCKEPIDNEPTVEIPASRVGKAFMHRRCAPPELLR